MYKDKHKLKHASNAYTIFLPFSVSLKWKCLDEKNGTTLRALNETLLDVVQLKFIISTDNKKIKRFKTR